ncbi:hypothetical protein STEG23_007275, partial [Scotinomys teguina]
MDRISSSFQAQRKPRARIFFIHLTYQSSIILFSPSAPPVFPFQPISILSYKKVGKHIAYLLRRDPNGEQAYGGNDDLGTRHFLRINVQLGVNDYQFLVAHHQSK